MRPDGGSREGEEVILRRQMVGRTGFSEPFHLSAARVMSWRFVHQPAPTTCWPHVEKGVLVPQRENVLVQATGGGKNCARSVSLAHAHLAVREGHKTRAGYLLGPRLSSLDTAVHLKVVGRHHLGPSALPLYEKTRKLYGLGGGLEIC